MVGSNILTLRRLGFALGLGGLLAGAAAASPLALYYEKAYQAAGAALKNAPQDTTAAWQFARACFDWAEYATNHTQRAALAEEGIAAARHLLERQPDLAPARYYLALNLGQLARTRSLGALKLVGEMERELKSARDLEPKFDFGGADRTLGLLYRDAPGWPLSVGSLKKAREHLAGAVALCPDFPENRLCLLELELKTGDRKAVQTELGATERVLAEARAKFTGEAWQASWADWEARWKVLRSELDHTPRPAVSPRGSR